VSGPGDKVPVWPADDAGDEEVKVHEALGYKRPAQKPPMHSYEAFLGHYVAQLKQMTLEASRGG
jgi:hypothetical protein